MDRSERIKNVSRASRAVELLDGTYVETRSKCGERKYVQAVGDVFEVDGSFFGKRSRFWVVGQNTREWVAFALRCSRVTGGGGDGFVEAKEKLPLG